MAGKCAPTQRARMRLRAAASARCASAPCAQQTHTARPTRKPHLHTTPTVLPRLQQRRRRHRRDALPLQHPGDRRRRRRAALPVQQGLDGEGLARGLLAARRCCWQEAAATHSPQQTTTPTAHLATVTLHTPDTPDTTTTTTYPGHDLGRPPGQVHRRAQLQDARARRAPAPRPRRRRARAQGARVQLCRPAAAAPGRDARQRARPRRALAVGRRDGARVPRAAHGPGARRALRPPPDALRLGAQLGARGARAVGRRQAPRDGERQGHARARVVDGRRQPPAGAAARQPAGRDPLHRALALLRVARGQQRQGHGARVGARAGGRDGARGRRRRRRRHYWRRQRQRRRSKRRWWWSRAQRQRRRRRRSSSERRRGSGGGQQRRRRWQRRRRQKRGPRCRQRAQGARGCCLSFSLLLYVSALSHAPAFCPRSLPPDLHNAPRSMFTTTTTTTTTTITNQPH